MFDRTGVDRRKFLGIGAGAVTGIALAPKATYAQGTKTGKGLPVSVVSTNGDSGTTLIELMQSQGFLKKYDLDADFVTVSDGTKITAAIISGNADICRASGFGQTLAAISKGAELKVIGGAELVITQAIYTTRPEIKTLKDLEGRVVGSGATGALLHHMTSALLTKNGVDVNKVKFVNVGSSTDVFRAVVAGTVDAGPGLNNVHDEQAKYGVHSIAEFWNDLPEYPYQACYTSVRVIEKKRDVLVRSLACFQELYNFIQSDAAKDAYVEASVKSSGSKDRTRAVAQWSFLNKHKPFNIILPESRIQYLQKLNIDAGIQKTMVPMDKIIDASLAQDALKLIG